MHLEFHDPRRSQVAPSVYLSDAILAVWFHCVCNYLEYIEVSLCVSAEVILYSDRISESDIPLREVVKQG